MDEYYVLTVGKNEVNFIEKISEEKIERLKEESVNMDFNKILKTHVNKIVKYKNDRK